MKLFRNQKGTVSVLLTLLLVPTLIVSGLVTDAARIYGAKSMISDAGMLAMNAGLTQYDNDLKDNYGLMSLGVEAGSLDIEKYFLNTIRSANIDGTENISKLLDLSADSLTVTAVDGSQIYQTEVEKAQILEYMKYRAPVVIVEELLDKLNEVKEVKSQIEALEAEAEFTEDLEDLDDKIKKAKEALDKYIEMEKDLTKDKVAEYELGAYDNLKSGTKHLLMGISSATLNSDDYAMDFMSVYTSFNEEASRFREAYDKSSHDDAGLSKLYDNYYVLCNRYYRIMCNYAGSESSLEGYIKQKLKDSGIENVDDAYDIYKQNRGILDVYSLACTSASLGKREIQYGIDLIELPYDTFGYEEDYLKTAITEVGKIKDAFEKVQGSFSNWNGKVDGLSDGDFKSGQKDATKEYSDLLNVEDLKNFQATLDANLTYIQNGRTYLKEYKYFDQLCVENYMNTKSDAVIAKIGAMDVDVNCLDDINKMVTSFMNEKFVSPAQDFTGILTMIESNDFYKELSKLCEENKSDSSKEKKSEGKSKAKDIFDMNDFSDVEDGISNLQDANWDGIARPSTLLSANNQPDDSEGTVSISNSTDASKKGARKSAIKEAKSALSSMKNFLGKLDSILTDNVINLYLMEYGVQMFSYYTVDKDKEGITIEGDITSMSGDDLTAHKMYKSEAEYILWGKDKAKDNVNATRGLLFGIRFVFGLIYAFSDGQINTYTTEIATAISCGVAFLVPIIHFVLNIAVAAAEAAFDVTDLMEGKSVPIIKKSSNSQVYAKIFGKKPNADSDAFGMNYKEYLCLFMLLHMVGEFEKSALARMADCIQLNEDLDITKSYTMIAVKSDVKIRTTFLRKASSWSERNTITSDSYTIGYNSCLGY